MNQTDPGSDEPVPIITLSYGSRENGDWIMTLTMNGGIAVTSFPSEASNLMPFFLISPLGGGARTSLGAYVSFRMAILTVVL